MILSEFSGNRIEFERVNGMYRLLAATSATLKPGNNGVKMLMGFEQDSPVERSPRNLETCLCCRVKLKCKNTS